MPTLPDPTAPVNPSPHSCGFVETHRMELDHETGLLYLKEHDPETDDHACLGHIEDADVPQEFDAEFRWLLAEWRDRQRFAAGCAAAAEGAFRTALGDVSRW